MVDKFLGPAWREAWRNMEGTVSTTRWERILDKREDLIDLGTELPQTVVWQEWVLANR